MVKMETRHPVEGQFGSEFPAICNHCGWRLEAARPGNFVSNVCVFFRKTTAYDEIFKILFRKFSPPHRPFRLHPITVTVIEVENVFFRQVIWAKYCLSK